MSQPAERTLMSFDWAMKSILRDKANFDVLEGFLTALLGEEIQVLSLLESEGNQRHEREKYNRVDLAVQDAKGEIILIEIQHDVEVHYLKRLLFGAAKLICDSLELGKSFAGVRKVISIGIVYFPLHDENDDYLYHGYTEFYGVHTKQPMRVAYAKLPPLEGEQAPKPPRQMVSDRKQIFPEYYLIDVVQFQNIIQNDIDEWIYLFKNSKIREDFHAKNIQKAGEKLDVLKMNQEERRAYERYLYEVTIENDVMLSAHLRGLAEGHAAGHTAGHAAGVREEKLATAKALLNEATPLPLIAKITGLTIAEIQTLT